MGWDPCYQCGGLEPDGKGHRDDCIFVLYEKERFAHNALTASFYEMEQLRCIPAEKELTALRADVETYKAAIELAKADESLLVHALRAQLADAERIGTEQWRKAGEAQAACAVLVEALRTIVAGVRGTKAWCGLDAARHAEWSLSDISAAVQRKIARDAALRDAEDLVRGYAAMPGDLPETRVIAATCQTVVARLDALDAEPQK